MDYISWFKKRSPRFMLQRGRSLLEHYGLGPQKAIQRIDALMNCFEQFGCAPTYLVPGRVIENNMLYIRSLQNRGAEIAIHGYNHVDLKEYNPQDASSQLLRAVKVFKDNGFEVHGFRCPYLSSSNALLEALPVGIFSYSSNKAVRRDFEKSDNGEYNPDLYETICRFYMAEEANSMRCSPWFQSGLVEIPVSVPDDLQMKDGLGYSQEKLTNAWLHFLNKTYAQGEIFNLMFHPELASYCLHPFIVLLQAARMYYPKVWVARLCDIAQWWMEKSTLSAEIKLFSDNSLIVTFPVSSRAHWVARGMDLPDSLEWIGKYRSLLGHSYNIPVNIRPFIGIDKSIPAAIIEKLINQGYILDQTESASNCSIFLDKFTLAEFPTEAALVDMIEISDRPIIRLWPWPEGYRSALCITGDLDALSLMDYFNRLKSNK